MNELTGADIWRIRDALERDAAHALGSAMFAFSGLDMNLGLMVASILRDTGREKQVSKADSMSFNLRLEFVEEFLVSRVELDPAARKAMQKWLAEAHLARTERNQLVHGRWSADPQKMKALNTVGLPSSDAQVTYEYTIQELTEVAKRFTELSSRLSTARMRWRLP